MSWSPRNRLFNPSGGGGIMINKILKKIFAPDVAGWIGRTGVYPALAFASPPVTKPVAPTTRA